MRAYHRERPPSGRSGGGVRNQVARQATCDEGGRYGAAVTTGRPKRDLIPLGEGVYTITEVCRILHPSMTRGKVHYWLNTGLLSEPPVAHAGKGVPVLLTFRQLLEIRTVQYLRDELRVSLPKVREAFAWVLRTLFAEAPTDVRFERGPGRNLIATRADGESVVVATNQGAFPMVVDSINTTMAETRLAWEQQAFPIPGHPQVVANTRILAGAPTVQGTRVDTAVVAAFASPDGFDDRVVAEIMLAYPRLTREAVLDALSFEGVQRVA